MEKQRRTENVAAFTRVVGEPLRRAKQIILLSADKFGTEFTLRSFVSVLALPSLTPHFLIRLCTVTVPWALCFRVKPDIFLYLHPDFLLNLEQKFYDFSVFGDVEMWRSLMELVESTHDRSAIPDYRMPR